LTAKRHPVLYGLMIYGLVAAGLILLWQGISYFQNDSWGHPLGRRIAVVPIRGMITDSRQTVDLIKKYRKDPQVKAIILRIESPGGGTAASQEIYREVKKTVSYKKVVASMGNVAASGGYYVALAANRIVANPASLTGSIGVILEVSNIQELMRKIGVSREAVKSGPYKDIASPLRAMTPEERSLLQEVIRNVHEQFIEAVMEGRKMSRAEVEKIADGRIFTGRQAKELGLVDDLGSFEDAVDLTKKMVGLHGEIKLIYPETKRFSFWDLIFGLFPGEMRQQALETYPALQFLWLAPYGSSPS